MQNEKVLIFKLYLYHLKTLYKHKTKTFAKIAKIHRLELNMKKKSFINLIVTQR
jgi:hypothetical protein